MSLATSNRDGGRTSESGHLRAIQKAIIGEVLTGLTVSQRGAGANMSVDIAIGDAIIPRGDGTYGHPAWNDAVYNQVIAAADVSNPRRDIIVMYIDYAVTPSTGVSNNTNGVVKIKAVAGTPAGSPSDPSDSAIQSSVGSGNPYIKLARVRVAAGGTSITNSIIDDLRAIASGDISGGWINAGTALALWAFSSFSSTTRIGVITVPTDITTKISAGMKIKVWQLSGGWKYGFVVGATATTITVFFGAGVTLNNEAMYLPSYSMDHSPFNYTGPVLTREGYQADGVNSERWVYEVSGWRANLYPASPSVAMTLTMPITFAAVPIVNCTFAGDSGTGTATALGNGGNTVEGRLFQKIIAQTTSSFQSMTHQGSGANFAAGKYYINWSARGPVN